eukprot:786171-Rhodomonas_salina.1
MCRDVACVSTGLLVGGRTVAYVSTGLRVGGVGVTSQLLRPISRRRPPGFESRMSCHTRSESTRVRHRPKERRERERKREKTKKTRRTALG